MESIFIDFKTLSSCDMFQSWNVPCEVAHGQRQILKGLLPFLCTVDQQTVPLFKSSPQWKGQTNINKCIRTWLNVQHRHCPNHKKKVFLLREKRATWSRVSAVLCFGVDALKQIIELLQKTKNKQTVSSFCSLNLYIKCNVRSYQYSTCQCVSPVSFQRSPWRWCQHWMSSFVFYLNMKFFHRSAIFNFSRGQSGRCTNIYFSMFSQVCITYRSCYVTYFFLFCSFCEDAVQPL